MIKMTEDFNHIDQIIRQKFGNFEPEPPIQVWENIKSGINKNPPAPSSPGIMLPIVVSISILIFLSGLLYNFNDNNAENTASSPISIQTASVISTGSTTASDPTLQNEFYQTPPELTVPELATVISKEPQQEVIPVRVPFEQNLAKDRKKKSERHNTSAFSLNTPSTRGQWKPGLVQAIQSGELSYADAVKYDLSLHDIRKLSGYSEYAKKSPASWSLGVYFNPEVSNFQDDSFDNTISYNIGVLPRVSFNHFFLQSGINMRFTNDKGNYAVDYNRFLGSYEDVYRVTFDSTENGVVPTYYTQTVDVYDTINHYSIHETKANYTYLEIPLFLGYSHTFGRFSLFAKVGPAVSFLVTKNVPEADYPEDKAKIVNVNYQIPARSGINWQMMMGAGFDYMLADKISFSLEPTFRFALKPEYKLTEGAKGNTNSFGIRAGLNYNF
jgi:hypothetical protein